MLRKFSPSLCFSANRKLPKVPKVFGAPRIQEYLLHFLRKAFPGMLQVIISNGMVAERAPWRSTKRGVAGVSSLSAARGLGRGGLGTRQEEESEARRGDASCVEIEEGGGGFPGLNILLRGRNSNEVVLIFRELSV